VSSLLVYNNHAPVINSVASNHVVIGQKYQYPVDASDEDNDELTYTLSDAPEGMRMEGDTVTWEPTSNVSSSGNVTLTVSDGFLTDTETFEVNVNTSAIINSNSEGLTVFPNPAHSLITVKNDQLITRLQLISISGKTVIDEDVNDSYHTINVQELVPGIYRLKIKTVSNIHISNVVIE
jgi:hypothetical protein